MRTERADGITADHGSRGRPARTLRPDRPRPREPASGRSGSTCSPRASGSVEVLAARVTISVGLASAHLLRPCGVPAWSSRAGMGRGSCTAWLETTSANRLAAAVRSVATGRIADAGLAARAYLGQPMEAVSRAELLERVRSGDAVVVDLRLLKKTRRVMSRAPISSACRGWKRTSPTPPAGVEVVAVLPGSYRPCRDAGRRAAPTPAGWRARRLEDGFPEWRLAGLPVATGLRPGGSSRLASFTSTTNWSEHPGSTCAPAAEMRPSLDPSPRYWSATHVGGRTARRCSTGPRPGGGLLGGGPDEIVLTSGGSEADNFALTGVFFALRSGATTSSRRRSNTGDPRAAPIPGRLGAR